MCSRACFNCLSLKWQGALRLSPGTRERSTKTRPCHSTCLCRGFLFFQREGGDSAHDLHALHSLYIGGSSGCAWNRGALSGIGPRSQARSSSVEFEPFRWAWGRPVFVTCRPRKAGEALMARHLPCCLLIGRHSIETLRGGATTISRQ